MSVSQGACLGQQDAWTPFSVLAAAGLLNAGALCCAVLRCAALRCAVLRCAALCFATLCTRSLWRHVAGLLSCGTGPHALSAAVQPSTHACAPLHCCTVGDIYLISQLGMGVAGAAIATAGAQVRSRDACP